ncbi:hypothetical protein Bhyg_12549 [Pseudolycoriella hygida]|uniref:Uncharacterized protein n=1 Tax=Pseudolycoriella hygida TaxID=35572 RepID=A0A9Q0MXF5_9DIPT|nr:hypothetical protein Bhyg_12549 [Pseudolycoriella hygida]
MLVGNRLPRETQPPQGFRMPRLPITRLKDLIVLKNDLENVGIYNLIVKHEKQYCAASNSPHTVTMTSYLTRFIDVNLRASLVLKDLKGQKGLTLYHDFHKIYLFLVDVMTSGYNIEGKILTNIEVHVVLRTVWGLCGDCLSRLYTKNQTNNDRDAKTIATDYRTLLRTPVAPVPKYKTLGVYVYLGVRRALRQLLTEAGKILSFKVLMQFFVDGFKISESTKDNLWIVTMNVRKVTKPRLTPKAIGCSLWNCLK